MNHTRLLEGKAPHGRVACCTQQAQSGSASPSARPDAGAGACSACPVPALQRCRAEAPAQPRLGRAGPGRCGVLSSPERRARRQRAVLTRWRGRATPGSFPRPCLVTGLNLSQAARRAYSICPSRPAARAAPRRARAGLARAAVPGPVQRWGPLGLGSGSLQKERGEEQLAGQESGAGDWDAPGWSHECSLDCHERLTRGVGPSPRSAHSRALGSAWPARSLPSLGTGSCLRGRPQGLQQAQGQGARVTSWIGALDPGRGAERSWNQPCWARGGPGRGLSATCTPRNARPVPASASPPGLLGTLCPSSDSVPQRC